MSYDYGTTYEERAQIAEAELARLRAIVDAAGPPTRGAVPIGRVVNNNQPGALHVIECPPHTTLDVGTPVYTTSELFGVAIRALEHREEEVIAQDAELARLRAELSDTKAALTEARGETYPKPTTGWQCFHCGEWFRSISSAESHFGTTPECMPKLRTELTTVTTERDELRAELDAMTARKDDAYRERNKVVRALAAAYPSGIARTAIEGWSDDWHGCVYIDLPTGQVSWHYHDSEAALFAALPAYPGAWDGHDTPEKYRRLAALDSRHNEAAMLSAKLERARAATAEAIIRDCIPGGSICDPQQVADAIRAWAQEPPA